MFIQSILCLLLSFNSAVLAPDAVITLDPNQTVLTCAAQSIEASTTAQTNVVYSWILNGNTGDGLSFTVDQPGQLILIATDTTDGCESSQTITILEDFTEPVLDILEPEVLNCFNNSISLDGSFSIDGPDVQFQWLNSAKEAIPNETDLFLDNVTMGGLYYLEGLHLVTGCTSLDSVLVIEDFISPVVNAGADFVLPCSPKKGTLSGSADIDLSDASSEWTNNAGNVLASNFADVEILEAGTYFFTVTSTLNGCSGSDEVVVGETSLGEVQISSVVPDCPGDTNGEILLDVTNINNPPVDIIFDGVNVGSQTDFIGLEPGTYDIEISDGFNCSLDSSFVLSSANDFSLSTTDDATVAFNESINLLADTDAINPMFEWSPAQGLSCTDCPDPIAQVNATITYTVIVTDENGCTKEESVTLNVDTSNSVGIFMANVFSPDSDSDNSFFYVQGNAGVFSVEAFEIYDRWGNLVFSATETQINIPEFGWDGSFNGKDLSSGVYAYYAKLTTLNGDRIIKGDVSLIR